MSVDKEPYSDKKSIENHKLSYGIGMFSLFIHFKYRTSILI